MQYKIVSSIVVTEISPTSEVLSVGGDNWKSQAAGTFFSLLDAQSWLEAVDTCASSGGTGLERLYLILLRL